MKYLNFLTQGVEQNIAALLSKKIALAFDGWWCGSEHYVAVFATYESLSLRDYNSSLLAFSNFEDDESQLATNHIEFLKFLLEVFGKDISNMVAFIAYNSNTNRLIAQLCDKPLMGCNSHRFNVAVVDYMSTHTDAIDRVAVLISKLRSPVSAAKLR